MNIAVCIKQVPDVDDIKWTKENNLDRTAMLSKINLYDEWALDYAVKIKSKFQDCKITVISMGPMQAKEVLYHALAKGADRAILLSDKSFSGSDTLATSKILASAIQKYIPDFNLIITGQMAQDGDTAQVPVSLSQILGIIDTTNVVDIYNADKDTVIAAQKIDDEIRLIEMSTPCLVAVKKECEVSYNPKVEDYIKAQNTLIEIYGAEDINLSKEQIGIIGSPTIVYKAFRPKNTKNAVKIEDNFVKKILDSVSGVNKQ